MKARRHLPPARNPHPNVTPLIDVVMVLIVFFMLVARIGIATGADIGIHVPATILGTDIKDMGNTLTLNVKPPVGRETTPAVSAVLHGITTQLPVAPAAAAGGNASNLDSPLVATLRYFREGDPARHVAANPAFKVIIRADESLDYQYLQRVLEACAKARVTSFSFDTRRATVATP